MTERFFAEEPPKPDPLPFGAELLATYDPCGVLYQPSGIQYGTTEADRAAFMARQAERAKCADCQTLGEMCLYHFDMALPSDYPFGGQKIMTVEPLAAAALDAAETRCVACGRTASEHNTYHPDADGKYTLIQLPKFAICESCVPTCSETMIPQDSDMEPEEAVLRCWFSAFKNQSVPFDELAEQLMDRESALLSAVTALREAVRLADDYIEKSPRYPDIYADQWEAWKLYDADRAARHAPGVSDGE